MREYTKIANIFEFDEAYRTVLGLNPVCKLLKDIQWIGTEKVDGTNVRIYWDGYDIQIAGRKNGKSKLPDHLVTYLESIFKTKEMEYVFEQIFGEKEAYLFGEGFGYKVQADGDKYVDSNEVDFILFDVNIDGWDLDKTKVKDIATRLNLKCVPIVFTGTLDEAIEFVKQHNMSTLGKGEHEMEGLVLEPTIQLYTKDKKPVKYKCRYNDLKKCNLL